MARQRKHDETDEERKVREEEEAKEAALAEGREADALSAEQQQEAIENAPSLVNPRKPAHKDPTYAPGTGPSVGSENKPLGGTPPDPRIPPENLSANRDDPNTAKGPGMATDAGLVAQPAPQLTNKQREAAEVKIVSVQEAGLQDPHLRPGLDPLPEEEPTPSTVPIPPPGPRRVA